MAASYCVAATAWAHLHEQQLGHDLTSAGCGGARSREGTERVDSIADAFVTPIPNGLQAPMDPSSAKCQTMSDDVRRCQMRLPRSVSCCCPAVRSTSRARNSRRPLGV